MRLYELLNDVKIRCSGVDLNMEISNIASDSRKIKKGSAFVAIKGEKRDGNDFVEEAIKNKASVIITDQRKIYHSFPVIFVNNAREALAKMWSAYYENPTKNLKVIAITGTNGKTSSAHILYSILKRDKKARGLISTVNCLINDVEYDINGGGEVSDIPSAMTTPDPSVLYRIFYEMKKAGVEYVVMEASSHALSQHRLSGAEIYLGAFTNLSPEHLDYHESIECYFESKKMLFKMCKLSIINVDDKYGKILKKDTPLAKTISINSNEDFYAKKIDYIDTGCVISLDLQGDVINVKSNLIGTFAPYNILLAASCAKVLGISTDSIKQGIIECKSISGRMEKIRNNIFIDYAHTPEAMKNVLASIKSIYKDKRVIALFGCGGNRDKSKRSIMGKIASTYCDEIIITSDNSRNEEAMDIIDDIIRGIEYFKPYYIIPDRKEAINFAVKRLKDNEILLLLGKGHEQYEIDSTGKHYFNEKDIVEEIINNV